MDSDILHLWPNHCKIFHIQWPYHFQYFPSIFHQAPLHLWRLILCHHCDVRFPIILLKLGAAQRVCNNPIAASTTNNYYVIFFHYLPIQKLENISSSNSSVGFCPKIDDKATCAFLMSSARMSYLQSEI